MKKIYSLFGFLLLLLNYQSITAQANCAGAIPITINGTCLNGSVSNTTDDAPLIGTCSGGLTFRRDRWYTFTISGGPTSVTIVASASNQNLLLQLIGSTGSCTGLTTIACANATTTANSAQTETITTGPLANGIYYVKVVNVGNNSNMNLTSLCINTPPANSTCATATTLSCSTTNLAGTTVGTNGTINHNTGCASSNHGVWYTFVGDGQSTTISTTAAAGFDHSMAIASGSCGSLTNISCQDVGLGGGSETYTFTTTIGVNYFIYIAYYGSGTTTGNFTISRSCSPPIDNSCANATTLNCGTTNLAGSTIGTTNTTNHGTGCSMSNNGIWYTFTGDGQSTTISSTAAAGYDHEMSISSGSCGTFTNITCQDIGLSGGTETYTFTTTIGVNYFVYISYYGIGTTTGNFTISRSCIAPCSPGTGSGTTSTACPSNVAGGLGLNGVDPDPINSCSASSCTTLEATFNNLGNTSTYTVQSIPYAPPYQFGCLANSVSVAVDDVWSDLITLPFNFCFYGNTYNQFIVGSNGIVSFNTTSSINTPGGMNDWDINTNIPNPALALNSIFGAYHDIDPSESGEVGWELVTMPSGCRAMVIGWSQVPMFSFSCSSMLYTGMMVLYENTNIIDVFIKDKPVCASWNDGNAIVGVQNNTGTQAVVAPGRNGLDSDWTATNEAWRFMPAGTSISTITWFEGSGTTGTIVGTTPTISVCPTVTTTYTARVRYTFCNGAIVDLIDDATVTIDGQKTWNGSVDTDWNKPNNWTPSSSIPDDDDCVVIPTTPNNPIISGSNYQAYAGNLIIQNGASLTVTSNNTITVTDKVTVNATGTFNLQNNSSLVQVNNVANTGNINYTRNASIRRQDYVYWSSPVAGFNTSNIGAPTTSGLIWRWNPTIANTNGGQGNWELAAGNTMTNGRGYIVRGPDSFSNTVASTLVNTFTGVPNNGLITASISRGSDTNTAYHVGLNGTEINNYSDNWNLIGNPYPSSIRASQFLFNNQTKIMGNIKIWTHGTLPAQIASPFYNSYLYNYSPGDYLTYNFTGTSCCPAAGSDYFIGAGQGFFVQMVDGPAATDNVTFNNGLRSNTYTNSTFYRTADNIIDPPVNTNIERHRFWLDIVNSNLVSERSLIGYVEGASNGVDHFYDSNTMTSGAMNIFSLIGTNKFQIQGRKLPFNSMDEVPIGFTTPANGFYSIALAAVDGLFQTQNIYIRDKDLNIIHNLKNGPYRFYNTNGTRLNRFIIIYNYNLRQDESASTNEVVVISADTISVQSTMIPISSVTVFDMIGRVIGNYEGNNEYSLTLENLPKNNTPLIIQTKLSNGDYLSEKIIF